jgi:hypothetical protein
MEQHDWIKQFPGAIIVCDCKGVILAMNDRAAKTSESDGGYALIGKNLLDCHQARQVKWKDYSCVRKTCTQSKRMASRN